MEYVGNRNRDLHVLRLLKAMADAGEAASNDTSLDERFLRLMKCGETIDISYVDIVNPLSSDLHDAVFNLRQNRLISPGSPISLTARGLAMMASGGS